VEALEAALDDARTAADRYRQDLAARTRDVEWLREKLSEAREHLAHRDAETGALRSELTRTARDLAAATESLAEARRAADEAGLTIARQQADIARLHDAASRVERAAADARREVEALHRSFSWRLTAPARAVARALWGR
jgi:chromosome segregation ATPase